MSRLGPINVGVGRTVVQACAASAYTCAVLDSGALKCFGWGSSGQLGQDSSANIGATSADEVANLAPINVGTNRTVKQVACGGIHTCAILDNDQLKCWGGNDLGQLGIGSTTNAGNGMGSFGVEGIRMADLPAVNLGSGRTAKQVGGGRAHTCVVLDNGTLKCWGAGFQGQLGYDSQTAIGATNASMNSLGTVNVGTNRTVLQVACGQSHTCALLDDGSVKCWGDNTRGQLGQDNMILIGDGPGEMAALQPVNLGGRTAKYVGCGAEHSCAILDDDKVRCWGKNNVGQLGQDTFTNRGDQANEMANLIATFL